MAHKTLLVFCAVALSIKSAFSAYPGLPIPGPAFGFNGLANPLAFDGFAPGLPYERYGCGCGLASTGGELPCASASPISPVGVSVLSENIYEGPLAIGGNLPFLGTVALEGVLPTAGAGAVNYGCGCPVGIAVEEGYVATGIAPHAPGPYGPYGLAGPYNTYGGYGLNGFGAGWAGVY